MQQASNNMTIADDSGCSPRYSHNASIAQQPVLSDDHLTALSFSGSLKLIDFEFATV
jgi:hypothetical protein